MATTPYSRRAFLAGVVSTGFASAAVTFVSPGGRDRSDTLAGRPRLCTGTDITGARAAVIGMWDEANPLAKVEVDEVAGGSGAERDAMVERIRNKAVDIVNLDIVDVREFVKKGLVQEVSLPYRTYFPAVARMHQVVPDSGRFWAVPFNSDVGMLFCRSTRGLDLNRPLLPQVIRRAPGTPARKPAPQFAGQLRPTTANGNEAFVVNVLEHALAVNPALLNADGNVSYILADWQRALAPLRTAVLNGDVYSESNEDETLRRFESGVTYMRNWPAWYRRQGEKIELLPLPSGILGGQSLALVAGSRNAAASLRFIEFATSAAAQRTTAAYGLAPALPQVYDDLIPKMPYLSNVKSALEKAVARPMHAQYRVFADAVVRHVLPFLSRPDSILTDAFIEDIKTALEPSKK